MKINNRGIKLLIINYSRQIINPLKRIQRMDNTDNKLKNYFANTLNKDIKKYFKTRKELFNFIFHKKMIGKQQISTKNLTVPN